MPQRCKLKWLHFIKPYTILSYVLVFSYKAWCNSSGRRREMGFMQTRHETWVRYWWFMYIYYDKFGGNKQVVKPVGKVR